MNKRLSLLFVFMLIISTIIALRPYKAVQAQTDNLSYKVVFSLSLVLDRSPREPIGFTVCMGSLIFSFNITQKGSLVQQKEIKLGRNQDPSWFLYHSLSNILVSTNTCLQLNRLIFAFNVYNWRVDFKGNNYTYQCNWVEKTDPQYIKADDSRLEFSINNRTINIDLILVASLAKMYIINLSSIGQLCHRIKFDEPEGTHIRILEDGNLFIVTRYDIYKTGLSGKYYFKIHTLDPLTRQRASEVSFETLELQFKINLNPSGKIISIDRALLEALYNSSDTLVKDAEKLINEARIYNPDISAKLKLARLYLNDLKSIGLNHHVKINTFSLEESIKLACEAAREIYKLFLSVRFVLPIVLVIILIASLVVSYLVFNKNWMATIILFSFFSLIAFEFHPGLRLMILLMRPEALNNFLTANFTGGTPFFTIPISLVIGSLILLSSAILFILKRSGLTTIYGLAISTAIRIIKGRKLRGILVVLTIAAVTMIVVPIVTVKMVLPIANSFRETSENYTMIFLSKSWFEKKVDPLPSEQHGVFLMSFEEAIYQARKLKMIEYTPIAIAFCNTPELEGLIILANLTFMKNHLELNFSGDLKNGILVDEEILRRDSLPTSLKVFSSDFNITGVFDKKTLFIPGEEGLEDYIKRNNIFVGSINLDAIQTPKELVSDALLSDGDKRLVVSSPIIGLIDLEAIKNLSSEERIIAIIGIYNADDIAEMEEYLRLLISSHKVWLNYETIKTSITIISSYSAIVWNGIRQENVRLGKPLLMSFGDWGSIGVLMLIGSLIILNATFNSTFERRKEIMVMSSLGMSPRFVIYLFLMEGFITALMGSSLGYFLGYICAYQIVTDNLEVLTELYGPTPLLMVLLVAIPTGTVGPVIIGKRQVLKVVPSRAMLARGNISIENQKDGSQIIETPIRIKKDQLEPFSSLFIEMLGSRPFFSYGINIHSYQKVKDGIRLSLSYKKVSSFSERLAYYDVEIRYVPFKDLYNVVIVIPDLKTLPGYANRKTLMKWMAYELRDELLKITVLKKWISNKRDEENLK
ncbi:MAG: FtsX-like permease family protein [Thermoproteota archaeon]